VYVLTKIQSQDQSEKHTNGSTQITSAAISTALETSKLTLAPSFQQEKYHALKLILISPKISAKTANTSSNNHLVTLAAKATVIFANHAAHTITAQLSTNLNAQSAKSLSLHATAISKSKEKRLAARSSGNVLIDSVQLLKHLNVMSVKLLKKLTVFVDVRA